MSPLRAIVAEFVIDADVADALTERLDAAIVSPMRAEVAGLREELEEAKQDLALITNLKGGQGRD
jgi:FMN phosphatase YigB (HAD superfamily)